MAKVTVNLSESQAAALRAFAKTHSTTAAGVLRAAVDALDDHKPFANEIAARAEPDARGGPRSGAGRPRRTWMTIAELTRAIRQELERDDETFAMRLLAHWVADLRSLARPNDLARCLVEPATTGSTQWDTLIAATASRECRMMQLPTPVWACTPALRTWWFPLLPDPSLTARTMQRTPIDLSVRGIWLDANSLESA